MNAGDINIRITADYAQFDRDMNATVARAASAGKQAGSQFQAGMSNIGNTALSGVQKGLGGLGKQLFNPLAMAGAISSAFAEAIRTGDPATAYINFVKGLPIVGQFADLIEAIYDKATGAIESKDYLKPDKELDDIRRRGAEKRRQEAQAAADAIAAKEKAKADEVDRIKSRLFEDEYAAKIAAAKKIGDEERAQLLRNDLEQVRLNNEQEIALVGLNDEQNATVRQSFALRRQALRDEGQAALQAIREKAAADQKADAEKAARATEQIEKEKRERLEALREELAKRSDALERERLDAQTAGVTDAATALGSFKFDAYPEADKKRNDERIVGALESIRDQQKTAGFI